MQSDHPKSGRTSLEDVHDLQQKIKDSIERNEDVTQQTQEEEPVIIARQEEEVSLLRGTVTGSRKEQNWVNKTLIRADIAKYLGFQTAKQIAKSKVTFCLGFLSCFVVVLVVAMLYTILDNTPVVFLRLSELISGETDLIVTGRRTRSLNYTLISEILTNVDESSVANMYDSEITDAADFYSYHSPRATRIFTLYRDGTCDYNNVTVRSQSYSIIQCARAQTIALTFVIDSEREHRMGLGREWTLPPLGQGEIYLSNQLARDMGVRVGDHIYIGVTPPSLLGSAWHYATKGRREQLWISRELIVRVLVKNVYSNPKGKYDPSNTRAMILEYANIMPMVLDNIQWVSNETMHELEKVNLYEFAEEVFFNLPPKFRLSYYMSSDYDEIQTRLTHYASNVEYLLGFDQLRTHLPIVTNLQAFNILNMVLSITFNIIIYTALFICTILIYSLLITNVESRSFDIGMFRMIGMKRIEVIVLLVFQAISFSVLSYPFGLLAAQGLAVVATNAISTVVGIKVEPYITINGILASALLGNITPLIASIFPIRNALGRNLAEAIDTRNSKTKAVHISMERSEDNHFSWGFLTMGIFCVAFGFSVYYLLPLALVSFNISLMLYIFVVILLMMLLGCVILSLNLSSLLEKALVYLLLFWEKRAIRTVVLKNFVAHKLRNQKTTLLYAVSLAFIVFSFVSWEIQLRTFLYQQQQQNGCLMKVTSSGMSAPIRNFTKLEQYALASPYVEAFGWITHPLNLAPSTKGIQISNIGHTYSDTVTVYGVSPNLFDATLSEFLVVGSYDSSEFQHVPLLESLYTLDGSHSVITGATYEQSLGLDIKKHFLFDILYGEASASAQTNTSSVVSALTEDVDTTSVRSRRRLTPSGFLNSAPSFLFSKFPSVANQDMLVSLTTYLRLSNGQWLSVDEMPYRDFIIKMKSGLVKTQIDDLKDTLESLIKGSNGLSVWDYRDQENIIDTVSSILAYFFNFLTIIAMLVCFFSLNSSMYTNVMEQTKEIGILRAMGLSKFSMYRVFIYESMVIVLSSSLLGIFIGSFVGYTMVVQRALFTQLPIPFVFPSGIMILVVFFSMVCAIFASFGPIRFLLNRPIVAVLKYM